MKLYNSLYPHFSHAVLATATAARAETFSAKPQVRDGDFDLIEVE